MSILFGEFFADLGFCLEVVALPLVIFAAATLTKRGRRLIAKDAQTDLELDVRPPIVYLRHFTEDNRKSYLGGNSMTSPSFHIHYPTTYEERLAHALHGLGPFVALGQPNEDQLPLGASRMYAENANWRSQAEILIASAGLIFLRVSDQFSDNLAWELKQIVSHDKPERFILCFAEEGKLKANRNREYIEFKQQTESIFPRPLPPKIEDAQFLYFDKQWTAYTFGKYGSKLSRWRSSKANSKEDVIVSQRLVLKRLHSEFAAVNNAIFIFMGFYLLIVLILFVLILLSE